MRTPHDPDFESTQFSNFTPHAQQALSVARAEAGRLNHNFIGTEHVLLGIVKLDRGTAVTVLRKLKFDLGAIASEVERQVGAGPAQKVLGNIPYTPRALRVFAAAFSEARSLHHTYVGTEHILLGLLCEDGVAALVLRSFGVEFEGTRREILNELNLNLTPAPCRAAEIKKPHVSTSDPQLIFHQDTRSFAQFTPRAQQSLANAHHEADRLKHKQISTEHLLLGCYALETAWL